MDGLREVDLGWKSTAPCIYEPTKFVVIVKAVGVRPLSLSELDRNQRSTKVVPRNSRISSFMDEMRFLFLRRKRNVRTTKK